MVVRKVYIIIDSRLYSKEDVVVDIKAEGYKHEFVFGNLDHYSVDAKKQMIKDSDEVWCFGKCERTEDYKIAKELGADIWQMR